MRVYLRHIISFMLLFISGLLQAQKTFLTYAVSGSVAYMENSKYYPLKIGKLLTVPKTIAVDKNSKVFLVCDNTSGTIILKHGTYDLKNFSDSCTVTNHSLTAEYLKYVWWQLTHPHLSPEEEYKKIGGTGGSVSRGCAGVQSDVFFDTICYYKENITLSWRLTGSFKKKEFVIYEYENSSSPMITIPLHEDYFRLNRLKGNLETSREYFWNIKTDDKDICPRKLIRIWNKNDFNQFSDSIKKNSDIDVDKAEEKYLMGYFFEINNSYGEAYRFYKSAFAAKPGNERYKNTVTRFR